MCCSFHIPQPIARNRCDQQMNWSFEMLFCARASLPAWLFPYIYAAVESTTPFRCHPRQQRKKYGSTRVHVYTTLNIFFFSCFFGLMQGQKKNCRINVFICMHIKEHHHKCLPNCPLQQKRGFFLLLFGSFFTVA